MREWLENVSSVGQLHLPLAEAKAKASCNSNSLPDFQQVQILHASLCNYAHYPLPTPHPPKPWPVRHMCIALDT